MSNKLIVGNQFPKFNLITNTDSEIDENSLLNKKTVVFIYPKNDTGGCTKECVEFSNLASHFENLNISIYGISKDTVKSHKKFITKHDLKLNLISDPEVTLITDLGSWVKKSMYGKEYMGIERTTFILDKKNKITHIWNKVRVKGHAEDVLKACKTDIKEDNKI